MAGPDPRLPGMFDFVITGLDPVIHAMPHHGTRMVLPELSAAQWSTAAWMTGSARP